MPLIEAEILPLVVREDGSEPEQDTADFYAVFAIGLQSLQERKVWVRAILLQLRGLNQPLVNLLSHMH